MDTLTGNDFSNSFHSRTASTNSTSAASTKVQISTNTKSFSAPAAQSRSLTMRDAVLSAVEYSAEVRAIMASKAQAGVSISIAKSGYMPTLDSSAGIGTDQDYDYQVSLNQPLYDFGQTAAKISQARSGKDIASAQLREAKEKAALEAAQAYIAVQRAVELVDIASENITILKRFEHLAKMRSEGGVTDVSEVELAGVHLGDAESTLREEEGSLRAAQSAFIAKVGYTPTNLAEPSDLKMKIVDFGEVVSAAANAPAVDVANAREQEAIHSLDVEKASLYPVLSAEAYYRGGDTGRNDGTGIGLRVKGPTLNGFSNFQRVEAMNHAAQSARWSAEAAKRNAAAQVKEFIDREPTLSSQAAILDQQLKRAKKLRGLYEDQFKLGERKLIDLITVQSDIVRNQRSRVNARYDIISLQYAAVGALGKLLENLGIETARASR